MVSTALTDHPVDSFRLHTPPHSHTYAPSRCGRLPGRQSPRGHASVHACDAHQGWLRTGARRVEPALARKEQLACRSEAHRSISLPMSPARARAAAPRGHTSSVMSISPYSLAAQNSSYSPRGELGRHLERPPRHDIQPRASPRTCTLSTDVQRPDGRPACFMCAPHAHGSMPMERSWARRASMRRTMTRCSAARTSCSAWSTSGGTSTHAVPCSWA